jgi:hypothetical protein
MVLCFFAALGIGGLWATVAQSAKSARETTEASGKLGTALTNLGTSTTEIARMTTLNTQLQGKLLDASGTIANLARQNIANVTGGNSFCYLSFERVDQGFNFSVYQQGRSPLHSVLAQVTDYRKLRAIISGTEKGNIYLNIPVGDLSVKDARPLFAYPYPPADVTNQNFAVFFRALNGAWFEDAGLRKVNGTWMQAIRVYRMIGTKQEMLFEHHDAGYPLVDGKVDWNFQ